MGGIRKAFHSADLISFSNNISSSGGFRRAMMDSILSISSSRRRFRKSAGRFPALSFSPKEIMKKFKAMVTASKNPANGSQSGVLEMPLPMTKRERTNPIKFRVRVIDFIRVLGIWIYKSKGSVNFFLVLSDSFGTMSMSKIHKRGACEMATIIFSDKLLIPESALTVRYGPGFL